MHVGSPKVMGSREVSIAKVEQALRGGPRVFVVIRTAWGVGERHAPACRARAAFTAACVGRVTHHQRFTPSGGEFSPCSGIPPWRESCQTENAGLIGLRAPS